MYGHLGRHGKKITTGVEGQFVTWTIKRTERGRGNLVVDRCTSFVFNMYTYLIIFINNKIIYININYLIIFIILYKIYIYMYFCKTQILHVNHQKRLIIFFKPTSLPVGHGCPTETRVTELIFDLPLLSRSTPILSLALL